MITVAFSTRNGARTLPRMLAALGGLTPPDGGWCLVAVDNGSTDATPGLLADASASLPLTVLQEPQAGKNRALNRALDHIQGDLLVLTDDDIVPDADWLVRLAGAARLHPERDVFGGTIRPVWPSPPPAWLTDAGMPLHVLYALADRPSGACAPEDIYGPNMAVRASLFHGGLRFNPAVGPDGTARYAMGSETELLTRLARAGHTAWFAAEAVVGHQVRPEQMERDWVLGRSYRHGFGVGRRPEPPMVDAAPVIAGRSLTFEGRRAALNVLAALSALLPPEPRRFWWRYRAAWLNGLAEGVAVARAESAAARPAAQPVAGRS
ncbi:glycosyltransferase family 2 protein [Marinivivus vitaminiproducens]|uniref:glycosyltransferase family 2 protein n=1 Tax=Marinivivus vitaminiproducens TaxID=3035935 RepID=UPI002798515B|nr:glycosyltransferase [Geminicoccaceae bacterium SCSIO 64248]